jgi:hypothetical protein
MTDLNPYSNPDYAQKNPNNEEAIVNMLVTFVMNAVQGGWFRGYRTQILGVTGAITAVSLWLVGDASLPAMLTGVISGLAWSALGAKMNQIATALGVPVKLGTGATPKV